MSYREPRIPAREPLLSGNIDQARYAYHNLDKEKSRAAHQCKDSEQSASHSEAHNKTSSDFIKAFVFGGLDGVITIFAIVAGCVGAHLNPAQVIIVGIGNLFADSVSMGFGEYASAKTEQEFLITEKEREIWELENYPEGEKAEMMEIYIKKYHFTSEDARLMVDTAFKYPEFYITHMMAEELGILCDTDGPTSVQRGLVMSCAFIVFGLIPLIGFSLWSYLIYGFNLSQINGTNDGTPALIAASLISCVTLYTLGAIKAKFLHENTFKSGFQMTVNGGLAGLVAFSIGVYLRRLMGSQDV